MASGPVESAASTIASAAATNAVKAVETVAADPSNTMSESAVHDSKPEIKAEIEEAILRTPEIQHALNTEPFWRRRSWWGAVAAGLACTVQVGAAVAEYIMSNADKQEIGSLALGAALAAWGGYSSWRAGRTTVPLGRSATEIPPARYPMQK